MKKACQGNGINARCSSSGGWPLASKVMCFEDVTAIRGRARWSHVLERRAQPGPHYFAGVVSMGASQEVRLLGVSHP